MRRTSTFRQRVRLATSTSRMNSESVNVDSVQNTGEQTQYSTGVADQPDSGLRRRKGRSPQRKKRKAAEAGDVEEIELQLDQSMREVTISAYSVPDDTPLSISANNGIFEIANLLLRQNADVKGYHVVEREYALHAAAKRDHASKFQILKSMVFQLTLNNSSIFPKMRRDALLHVAMTGTPGECSSKMALLTQSSVGKWSFTVVTASDYLSRLFSKLMQSYAKRPCYFPRYIIFLAIYLPEMIYTSEVCGLKNL